MLSIAEIKGILGPKFHVKDAETEALSRLFGLAKDRQRFAEIRRKIWKERDPEHEPPSAAIDPAFAKWLIGKEVLSLDDEEDIHWIVEEPILRETLADCYSESK